jgi:hypothetical protein
VPMALALAERALPGLLDDFLVLAPAPVQRI